MAIGGKQRFMVVTGPTAAHFYFPTNGVGGNTETEASSELHALAANRNAALDGILITKVDSSASTIGICLGATGNSPSVSISLPTPTSASAVLPILIPIGMGDGIDTQGSFAIKPGHGNVEFVAFYRTDV